MTKFRTDVTKGGYKILSIHGPDDRGTFAGVVNNDGDYVPVWWSGGTGRDLDTDEDDACYDLIPLDEPEPSDTTELWNYVHSSSKEIGALRLLVEGALKRMDSMQADYIARVNGLRNDYLADKDAVSPARVDALEERLEILEYQELHKRLEALEQRTQPTDVGAGIKGPVTYYVSFLKPSGETPQPVWGSNGVETPTCLVALQKQYSNGEWFDVGHIKEGRWRICIMPKP
jgi:hypothetical protein